MRSHRPTAAEGMESMGEMMNTRDSQGLLQSVMPDVQGSADARQLPIQRVGVKAVRYQREKVVPLARATFWPMR